MHARLHVSVCTQYLDSFYKVKMDSIIEFTLISSKLYKNNVVTAVFCRQTTHCILANTVMSIYKKCVAWQRVNNDDDKWLPQIQVRSHGYHSELKQNKMAERHENLITTRSI